jgi:hypothetical protein
MTEINIGIIASLESLEWRWKRWKFSYNAVKDGNLNFPPLFSLRTAHGIFRGIKFMTQFPQPKVHLYHNDIKRKGSFSAREA